MDVLPTGSRGAVRLHLQETRSSQDPNDVLIASQQWTYQRQHASQTPRFTLGRLQSQAGSSALVQLTPPTIPSSSHHLSLYPGNDAEQGSSMDADIHAAQLFLRDHHSDLEIPDFVLSNVICDNAKQLEDTAHALDGSLGLSDAQATAVLGPVEHAYKQIYAVTCIGGLNRDCLLLHRLEVQIKTRTEADAGLAAVKQERIHHETPADGKGKGRELPSRALRFVPASEAARKYKTPILQIVAASDRRHLAIRTHTGTSFLCLQHDSNEHGQSRLYLEIIHRIAYGEGGFIQHQDICFSAGSPTVAAAIDRLGNVDLVRLEATQQQDQVRAELGSALLRSKTSINDASVTGSSSRGHFSHNQPASGSTDQVPSASVTVDHVRVRDHVFPAEVYEEDAPADARAPSRPSLDQGASYSGPFRILFGSDERSLLILSRHSLMQVKLNGSNAATDGESPPQFSTLLRSSFCVSSFQRARFFSVALSPIPDSDDAILAVCSSDMIYWIDLNEPTHPLFATAHNRGDDPTLTLARLPQVVSVQDQQSSRATSWALSSLRNQMISCYSVTVRPSMDPSRDSRQEDATTRKKASLHWRCTLDDAPALLPSMHSESYRLGAPPLFLDAAEIVPEYPCLGSILTFGITERGVLFAQLLHGVASTATEESSGSEGILALHVAAPSTDTILYEDGNARTIRSSDPISDVRTKLLDYRKLCSSLFGVCRRNQDEISSVARNAVDYFVNKQNMSSKGFASTHAATLSLGQLFRNCSTVNSQDQQQGRVSRGFEKHSWSNALDIGSYDAGVEAYAKAILDFRRDVRHVLPSLGVSSARLGWSCAANALTVSDVDAGQATSAEADSDYVERALSRRGQDHVAHYLPTNKAVQTWHSREQRAIQDSVRNAARQMRLDSALEAEVFLRPKVRLLDEGASTQRLRQREGTNWTAFEHREMYNFVEKQGSTIPPPNIGSVGLSFFAPLRSKDVQAAAESFKEQNGVSGSLNEAELETLLPSTSFTARLLLSEWQLGESPTEYTYVDPFEGLHRLPRASRLRGSTARARSRSFSRASSASGDERSRSRSRSRNASIPALLPQSDAFNSLGNSSSHPSSVVSHSQPVGPPSAVPPSLASRRKRQREAVVSRSRPIRAFVSGFERDAAIPPASHVTTARANRPDKQRLSAAHSQPEPPPFGFAGSFGDLTPTVSPSSSQFGAPTETYPTASTQIQAGRFGARPTKSGRPHKKKKRASGF